MGTRSGTGESPDSPGSKSGYDAYPCRATVEHPFGTLKAWMGSTHFLTKTLDRVSTEMSLHVLAYNMKRMMNIIGTKPLIEAIGA